MSKLFSGMLPFEIVLLMMGVVAFAVLIFLLIWNSIKKEKIIGLLPFFLIPVLLVGYPSVQSIQFNNEGLTIQKYTQAVTQDPTDTTATRVLNEKLEAYKSNPSRVMNNALALTNIANAQLALGNLDSARLTIRQASSIAPNSGDIQRTSEEIDQHLAIRQRFQANINQLQQSLVKLQSDPRDTAATGNITKVLTTLQQPTYIDASSALVMAKALAVMNQPAQSVQVIDKVLSTDHASPEARNLKAQIQAGAFSTGVRATPMQQETFRLKSDSLARHFNVIRNAP
jgi:tetratricopeptide (TPR) repeat protein